MTTQFGADSVQPLQGIPVSYRADMNKGALLYGDGAWSAAPDIAATFPRRLFISATGAEDTWRRCRILDVERGDASADNWPHWRTQRVLWEKEHDRQGWPIVYCSIDQDAYHGVKAVLNACQRASQEPPKHWWIAWYTAGAYVPTAAEVALEIRHVTGEEIPLSDIWGCQFADFGQFDKSVIYQHPGWE